jgi:protein phosphatase
MLKMVACTNVGQRTHNEDCFLADAGLALAVVADGMGGHKHGEVASHIVVETLLREVALGSFLSAAISLSHREVKHAVQDGLGGEGMGAAVVAALFTGYDYEICWVGDCRAYLWDGELVQLTRDHSHVETLLSRGEISWEEAQSSSVGNLITQAVGASEGSELDVGSVRGTLTSGQELLLCSDGLNDVLSGQALAVILNGETNSRERCEQLVYAAVHAGGKDNITALLITPDAGAAAAPASRPPAVSISRLDGGIEYFPAPASYVDDLSAESITPVLAESRKHDIQTPGSSKETHSKKMQRTGVRRQMRIDSAFLRSVLLGLSIGGLVAGLLLSLKWIWRYLNSGG